MTNKYADDHALALTLDKRVIKQYEHATLSTRVCIDTVCKNAFDDLDDHSIWDRSQALFQYVEGAITSLCDERNNAVVAGRVDKNTVYVVCAHSLRLRHIVL